jgi:hypothetical protein
MPTERLMGPIVTGRNRALTSTLALRARHGANPLRQGAPPLANKSLIGNSGGPQPFPAASGGAAQRTVLG